MNRPGVRVTISSAPAAVADAPSPGTLFLAGYADWGPVNQPVFIGTLRQARVIFGDPASSAQGKWIPRMLDNYLTASRNQGRAWVVRGFEFGAGKTEADYTTKATLTDGAAMLQDVLVVSAAYPGAVGSSED